MCCSNTPYLRVLKLLFNTVVAVYLKRIELFSSIAKKTLFFRYFNNFQHICSSCRGIIKFLCRRSVGFFSRALLVFLMKESKKRRQKQPGKLMAKSHSQPVNLPGARPLMNPLQLHCFSQVNLADRPVPILEWEKPLCSFRNLFHMCIFWIFFAALYHNLKREKSMRSKGMLGV